MELLELGVVRLLGYGVRKVLGFIKRRRSGQVVLISCDLAQSQLSRRGDTWCLHFKLKIRNLLAQPTFIRSVALASRGPVCRPIPSTGPTMLDTTASFTPGEWTSGWIAFDCGLVHAYDRKSIFDTTFTLHVDVVGNQSFRLRCRPVRWPEGTPYTLQYNVKPVERWWTRLKKGNNDHAKNNC